MPCKAMSSKFLKSKQTLALLIVEILASYYEGERRKMLIGELSADTMSSHQEFVLPRNKPDAVLKNSSLLVSTNSKI